MRPYLAIIKDSFRAATHSWMLWALLIVVTFMLALLIPFSYTEELTHHVAWREANWGEVMMALKLASTLEEPTPAGHIYGLLSRNLRERIDNLWEKIQQEQRGEPSGEEVERDDGAGTRTISSMEVTSIRTDLHRELDEALAKAEFYDAAAWAHLERSEEAEALLARDAADLSELELRRRNRLLLEAAFPLVIPRSGELTVRPTYAGQTWIPLWFMGAPDGTTKEAAKKWYGGYISVLMNWPVSMIMTLTAIIATAGIMPNMFQPGSISLLLSKPVSRPVLFLAQFAGGCTFMLLAATYFTLGTWLLAGVRLGIWNPKVFLCIPLFTFVFMVYYSVSALVGVWSRSGIVAVLTVIAFFYFCWSISVAHSMMVDNVIDAYRLVHLIPTDETLLASDDAIPSNMYFFDETDREWKDTFTAPKLSYSDASNIIYDRRHDQLLATDEFSGTLLVGRGQDGWERKHGRRLPPMTLKLLTEPDGDVLVVSRVGFFRLTGDALPKPQQATATETETDKEEANENAAEGSSEVDADEKDSQANPSDAANDRGGVREDSATDGDERKNGTNDSPSSDTNSDEPDIDSGAEEAPTADDNSNDADDAPSARGAAPADPQTEAIIDSLTAFTPAGPDKQLTIDRQMSAAMNEQTGQLAIYTQGTLALYESDAEGNYFRTQRRELPDSQKKEAVLALGGSKILVARDDGKVLVLDAATLQTQQEFSPEGSVPARFAVASPAGRFLAVLFHNRRLWMYDTQEKKLHKAPLWSQGEISAVAFSPTDTVLVADEVARVREFELPDWKTQQVFNPEKLPRLSDTYELPFGLKLNYYYVHRYFTSPLYTVLPKPGELGRFFRYITTGEETDAFWLSASQSISRQRHQQRNPWRAVWSSVLFVALMLAIGCWHIHRSEF